jgi:isoleucyl-tRNA synthetase
VRTAVLAKLEALRAEKVIGKSLEAVVTLNVNFSSDSDARLQTYASALPELFNVSEVEFLTVTHNDSDYLSNIAVRRSEQPKCERCWRYVADVGNEESYPTVCLRCAEALAAIGFPPYSNPEGAA